MPSCSPIHESGLLPFKACGGSYHSRAFHVSMCVCSISAIMKGTEVPNPRRSSACDCTCVLTRIDHCLVNNSVMTFALELIWHAF